MTANWLLGSCPKCQGALLEDHDGYDTLWVCWNCGEEVRNQEPEAEEPRNGRTEARFGNANPDYDSHASRKRGTTRGYHYTKKRCANHPDADVYSGGLCEDCHRLKQYHRKREGATASD